MSEMLATLDRAVFVERVSVDTPANVRKAKKAIKKAFEVQLAGLGFGIVEVLSTCPTNWGLTPVDSLQWLRDNMMPYYKLGNLKDVEVEEAK
jgi:2-oxoglutarate ferredoxin oxidoreductase subunit beta